MSLCEPIRILIADDHPVIRETLIDVLSRQPDMHIVATACNGEEAIALYRQHRPDVVLMDARMPKLDGLAATRQIVAEFPDACVVLLSFMEEPENGRRAGARVCLLKDVSLRELLRTLRAVHTLPLS